MVEAAVEENAAVEVIDIKEVDEANEEDAITNKITPEAYFSREKRKRRADTCFRHTQNRGTRTVPGHNGRIEDIFIHNT